MSSPSFRPCASTSAGRSARLASSSWSRPASKTTSTTTPSSLSSDALEAFVCQLQRLDCDLVPVRVQGGGMQLAGPRVVEVPANLLLAAVVQQDDRPVVAVEVPLDHALPPVPQLGVLRDAAFEDDVRVLRQPGQLAEAVLRAGAVLDHDRLALEAAHLAEGRGGQAVDLDQKPEHLEGVVARRRHDDTGSTSRLTLLRLRRRRSRRT